MKTKNTYLFSFLFTICFLAFSCIFVILGSWSTSPIDYVASCSDSAIYQTVGKSWSLGAIPYSDVWDLKGPYIFFVNALGYFITGTRVGVFILQVINLFVCQILIYKILRLKLKPLESLIYLVLSMFYYNFLYFSGNFTEEYCMPFLLASVYFQIKWLQTISSTFKHNWSYSFIYGLCYAVCTMTRITNFVIAGFGVLYIYICLIANKQWANLFKNIIAFLFGNIIFCLPFVLYFAANNALYDMVFGTFIYSIGYASDSSFMFKPNQPSHISELLPAYLILIFSVVTFVKSKNKFSKINAGFWFLASVVSLLWLMYCNAYRHYVMILLPYYCVMCFYLSDFIKASRSTKSKYTSIFITCLCLIISLAGVPKTAANMYNNYAKPKLSETEITEDTLISRNLDVYKTSFSAYDCSAGVYLRNNLNPNNRFFVYQSFETQKNSILETLIKEDFLNNPADWLLIDDADNSKIIDPVLDNYTLADQEYNEEYESFTKLYHKK